MARIKQIAKKANNSRQAKAALIPSRRDGRNNQTAQIGNNQNRSRRWKSGSELF
jgi:hypothetical protein